MGDRAMAQIKTEGGDFFVYTHWQGCDLPDMSKKAIKAAEGRWDDLPYANRIIVDQLTKEGRDSETGFGLMLQPDEEDSYNNNHPSVVIDLLAKQLTVMRDGETKVTPFTDLA